MTVIGGNQITSVKQIKIQIIAKALKDNGFHVTVPKDQEWIPTLIVKEYQESLKFIFNEKYGGTVQVIDKTGHTIIPDSRTMKTLTEAVVLHFVGRRKTESDIIIDAYKWIQSKDPDSKKFGMEKLAKYEKKLSKRGRAKYIIAFAKKQMKKEEEITLANKPTPILYKWGDTFDLVKTFHHSRKVALTAGKSYERKRHVCYIKPFGKLPIYALYVSRSVLAPNVRNPYKLNATSGSWSSDS